MNKENQNYILEKFPSIARIDESMKKHSSFGIGGKAKILFLPQKKEELKSILKYSLNKGIATFFMGSGSNILISDKGFDGILISLKRSFKNLDFYDNGEIVAGSGVMLRRMVKEAINKNLKGLESLAGVPGTLGGALYMNAGAYGAEISNYFLSARTMNMKGEEIEITKDNVRFSYRKSTFPKDSILLEARFKFEEGDIEKIKINKNKFSISRVENQPLNFRSAGSVFKNPSSSLAAGYLIDQAGLKGKRKGGAMISDKHANFIVNLGNAKSSDVIYLIKKIKEKVLLQFNVNLNLEIKLVGFEKKILIELGHNES
tara:strand:- start:1484 stop:2431 length:948 start_codon:yes stop_codon:yes gene_type:complete